MSIVKEVHHKVNTERAAELKEEMSQLEKDLEVAEKRAEEAEKKEDAMYEEFERDIRSTLDAKFQSYTGQGAAKAPEEINAKLYKTRMDEAASMIKVKQDDVMRTNKVIREVSRGINNDWQPIFEYLMAAQLSKADIKTEVMKIQRQNRPLMQAYKALQTWKDLKDESLGLNQLADALRITKRQELSNYVYDVLDCKDDSYMKLKCPTEEATSEEGAEGGKDGAKAAKKKASNTGGYLDDRKFLQLAKKIGTDWQPLATTLGLAEEDITEIMEAEGATYQGAFKMLWTWRDRSLEIDQDNSQVLQEALKACKKDDVAELI